MTYDHTPGEYGFYENSLAYDHVETYEGYELYVRTYKTAKAVGIHPEGDLHTRRGPVTAAGRTIELLKLDIDRYGEQT